MLLCSLLFGTFLFANNGETVVYINSVGTGKETEEMMELKDYIIDVYNRMQATDEQEIRRNSALAEQEVISNLGKKK